MALGRRVAPPRRPGSLQPAVPPGGFFFTCASRYPLDMLDERLAFLRTVAAIGGWAALLEIDAPRTLPAEAASSFRAWSRPGSSSTTPSASSCASHWKAYGG